MYYESALARITELEAKRLAILNNPDWSLEARNRQKAAWEREKAQARMDALTYLRSDLGTLRRRFEENESRRAGAMEAASQRWDYSRLQFETVTVRAMVESMPNDFNISGFDPVLELKKRYEAIKHEQNTHKQRAFCEIVPDLLLTKYQGKTGAASLAATLREDLDKLLTTPEITSAKQAGEALAELALNVIDVVKVAKRYYQYGFSGVLGPDEFDALLTGVRVEYGDYHGEHDRWTVTVSFDDMPNTAMVEKP